MENLDIEKEYKSIVYGLGMFSLSEYEVRAYLSLVMNGYGSAETIARTAGIPRTSAYKVLQMLRSKGFAFSVKGRPVIFKPESPDRLKKIATSRIGDIFDRLAQISELLSDRGEPHLIYTIAGRENVMRKIGEMLDRTEEYLVISTPSYPALRREIGKKLQNALNRKVEVTIISGSSAHVPQGVNVVRKDELLATDIVSDGERAFIADPGLDACGYTDNPLLAQHLERFLVISMEG
jgi:sugar-specific transcriptional regulator TrmB